MYTMSCLTKGMGDRMRIVWNLSVRTSLILFNLEGNNSSSNARSWVIGIKRSLMLKKDRGSKEKFGCSSNSSTEPSSKYLKHGTC